MTGDVQCDYNFELATCHANFPRGFKKNAFPNGSNKGPRD